MEKKILYCKNRGEWRSWLSEHFEHEREVWFVFPTLASGEAGVSYNDAVEEALCFGWIDGRAGKLDETHGLRRFTPRRKGSGYSQPNIERLIFLDSRGMIHPSVRPSVEQLLKTPFVFPEDILDEIKKDPVAWENYQAFAEPYKRIRVAYIDAARKRPAEFEKRLASFLKKTRENKRIVGYGGIDRYYESTAAPMTHFMQLHEMPFALIQSGKKTIELRLNDEKRQAIRVGDHILFNGSLEVEVVALHAYPDFEGLYSAFPLSALGYLPEEEATASPDDMLLYYTKEQIKKYGVLGIEIKLI